MFGGRIDLKGIELPSSLLKNEAMLLDISVRSGTWQSLFKKLIIHDYIFTKH